MKPAKLRAASALIPQRSAKLAVKAPSNQTGITHTAIAGRAPTYLAC